LKNPHSSRGSLVPSSVLNFWKKWDILCLKNWDLINCSSSHFDSLIGMTSFIQNNTTPYNNIIYSRLCISTLVFWLNHSKFQPFSIEFWAYEHGNKSSVQSATFGNTNKKVLSPGINHFYHIQL
jgi:hypothetical protein